MKKCQGRKNLASDIGILSLIIGVISSTVGMYTLVYNSMTSNNLGIISGVLDLLFWLPASVIGFFKKEGSLFYHLSNLINGASFFGTMLTFTGVWYGIWDVIDSSVGEVWGFISMALSLIATFPDFLDRLIEFVYSVGNRRQLEYVVDNYGCEVPSMFTFMGEHLYDILDRMLVRATQRVTAGLKQSKTDGFK